jgi:hypothetical protein
LQRSRCCDRHLTANFADWPVAAAGSPLHRVARYVLVDDRDGRVLAELASAEQAVRMFGRFARSPGGDAQVSVVRLDHQQGGLSEVTSVVSMRPLPPVTERRPRKDTR